MAFPVDYGNDWQWVDGVETLTLLPRDPADSSITGVKAVRASVSEAAASLGGDYGPEPRLVLFYVWVGTLSDYTPNQGDRINDDSGASWVIASTSFRSDESQWSLTCVKQT